MDALILSAIAWLDSLSAWITLVFDGIFAWLGG